MAGVMEHFQAGVSARGMMLQRGQRVGLFWVKAAMRQSIPAVE